MRSYGMGDPELDRRIAELVADACPNPHADLVAEIITTALKLHRDNPSRGDLKLVNTALKEMRYSMLVFSRHTEPKVTVFGSARTPEGHPDFVLAEEFSREMARREWGVITGAGPGIMLAGARGHRTFLRRNIRHPTPTTTSAPSAPSTSSTSSPAARLRQGSHAFAIFPELRDPRRCSSCSRWSRPANPTSTRSCSGVGGQRVLEPDPSVRNEVLTKGGYISPHDPTLFSVHHDPVAAADELCRFYANYHSQRYVNGRLVLRLQKAPDPETLARLNEEFSDIVAGEPMQVIEPTEAEIADNDALDLERISFRFDRRSFGRLRQLVDQLNDLVSPPAVVHPPAPMGEEQAERPW